MTQKTIFLRSLFRSEQSIWYGRPLYFILCNTTTGPLLFLINNYEICNSSIASIFSNLLYIDK